MKSLQKMIEMALLYMCFLLTVLSVLIIFMGNV
jgi:hypothetical protein